MNDKDEEIWSLIRWLEDHGHAGGTVNYRESAAALRHLLSEVARLKQWVADCQAGMYINCVYCGHRYGPDDEVPAAMADVLKAHIEQCPEHPMSKLREENIALHGMLDTIFEIATDPGEHEWDTIIEQSDPVLRGDAPHKPDEPDLEEPDNTGTLPVCPRCNGEGYLTLGGVQRPDVTCGACGGEGSQEKWK